MADQTDGIEILELRRRLEEAEETLREIRIRKVDAVTDLTEQKKNEDLREENRRKDEFLAMLAHELRNPLAPIRNAVAIINRIGSGDRKLKIAGEIIDRQVRHLTRLVDDLLDVSRISLGKVKLQLEPLELVSILTRAVETSSPVIESRNHQLSVKMPGTDFRVDADPTRLAQIIGNLLSNAAKYTEEGGQIFLGAEADVDQAIIRVRDTGMGIAPELLPRIFDLFTQGDRSLARSEGGLGIGLTLVRRLVDLHGGTVEAKSDGLGRGSEFIVRLPTTSAGKKQECVEQSDRTDVSDSPSRRILLVEDNVDGAESLALLLNLMGHQVRVAHNGIEALEAAEEIHPHAVLLDIGLPGMNGYDVAKQLQALPSSSSTALFAMTGYGQEEDKQRSRDAGFHHHLVKPVDMGILTGLLASLSPIEP